MIGLINFTHSCPLHKAYPEPAEMILATPREIISLIMDGHLSCGMVSLVEYFNHRDILDLEKSAVISSRGPVISTLLVSRGSRPHNGMKIAVTRHTRTTEMYLKYILQCEGIEYETRQSSSTEAQDLLNEAEFALVIGDEALKAFSGGLRIIWDIGYEFNRISSHAPVFAVTVRRKESDCTTEISHLNTAMLRAHEFRERCATESSRNLGIPQTVLRRYYSLVRYEFTTETSKSIDFASSIAHEFYGTEP
ncbi:MAG: MqnA/MqnD/SBP family protein [Thermoplasmataceae archaeon]